MQKLDIYIEPYKKYFEDLNIIERKQSIYISLIEVKTEYKNCSFGQLIFTICQNYASSTNKSIELRISDYKLPFRKLVKIYKKAGFTIIDKKAIWKP
jgi:hypothetical protein